MKKPAQVGSEEMKVFSFKVLVVPRNIREEDKMK